MIKKNKKGAVVLYFILFTLLVIIGFGIYLSVIKTEGLNYPGESSQRILSTIELANRVALYIDVAADQSLKNTILSLKEDSGFLIERSSDYETPFPCGQAVYPLLNQDKQEVECFPEYLETFKRNFERELTPKLHNFRELSLSAYSFVINTREIENEINVFIYTSPIIIPIYSHFASYYDEQLKREMSQAMPSYTYIYNEETGYFERGGLNRIMRSNPPDSIVLHYTAGYKVDHAYDTLSKSRNSYHYIIEKNGDIFKFVEEEFASQHAGCATSNKKGFPCQEGYNQRSIAISFVNVGHEATSNCEKITEYQGIKNKCWEIYPNEQKKAAIKLTADIFERQAKQGNFMKLNLQTIKTHQEIDPKRKWDPGPMFDKNEFIRNVREELRIRGYNYEI